MLCPYCAGTGLGMGHGTGWVPCPRGCPVPDDGEMKPPKPETAILNVLREAGRSGLTVQEVAERTRHSAEVVRDLLRRLYWNGKIWESRPKNGAEFVYTIT